MTALDLSASEWKYIAEGLRIRAKSLPASGPFKPFYDATTWHGDSFYLDIREDAIRSGSAVLRLVEDYKTKGKWPRGLYQAKFWLRARWEEAIVYSLALARRANASDCAATPVKEPHLAVRWLLFDAWDSQQVDFWLAVNLSDYTYFNHQKAPIEDYAGYSKWLNEIRTGRYLPKENPV